jgi:hypothetical protein
MANVHEEVGMQAGVQPVASPRERAAGGSNGRRIAFKVVAGVFTAGALGGFFGISIFFFWLDTSDGGIHKVHNMGYGALFGAILATGFLVQNWRPERKVSAFYQILDVGAAAIIGGAIATNGFTVVGGVIILVAYGILFALHPYRSDLLHPRREGFSLVLLTLTVLGAIPLIGFALTTARLQRDGVSLDPHVSQGHWALMASMAVGIVLVGFLSSFKFRGWRITACSAGAAAFAYGLASAIYPHHPGAEGTGWAWVAMVGGLMFIVSAEWEARRAPIGPWSRRAGRIGEAQR